MSLNVTIVTVTSHRVLKKTVWLEYTDRFFVIVYIQLKED